MFIQVEYHFQAEQNVSYFTRFHPNKLKIYDDTHMLQSPRYHLSVTALLLAFLHSWTDHIQQRSYQMLVYL